MPSSKPCLIPDVVNYACTCNPKSILDVGVGFGKYGVLLREYLDVNHGRYRKDDWKIIIDGVEIFRPYENDFYSYIYDRVFIEDCRLLLQRDFYYDLIMFNDVVEHFTKKEAFALLELVKLKCKNVIITIPIGASPQGAVYGNEHEKHLSTWTAKDLNDAGFRTFTFKENKGMFVK